jgi:hypothetical protein
MNRYRSHHESSSGTFPWQPAIVEIEVPAKLFGKTPEVIREWVRRRHLRVLGQRRKGQWYRFSFAYLLECADDHEWLSRGEQIAAEMWSRDNEKKDKRAANQKMKSDK